jgi:hypothetical protein
MKRDGEMKRWRDEERGRLECVERCEMCRESRSQPRSDLCPCVCVFVCVCMCCDYFFYLSPTCRIPVDECGNMIASVITNGAPSLSPDRVYTFHHLNQHGNQPWSDIPLWLNELGHTVEVVSFLEWRQRLFDQVGTTASLSNPLSAMLSYFPTRASSFPTSRRHFDMRNTAAHLKQVHSQQQNLGGPITASLIGKYLAYLLT